MQVPERLQDIDQQEAIIREYDYDDTTSILVDFGPKANEISVDVVGETVILVVSDTQFEFELPDDTTEITSKNGVLTIEG
ncbi:DUF7127 family protein [Haloarcula nitratireducens]|uniref:Hsp20/alpha crystallin family protein n=1 Tax=Haloarcula nitratireducens TaxID=2487749 RepID=A0AAW4PKX6_9EURY|nr:hypothetical protein [Halomicroarcula nitratireducens]MBX0297950.1 hypothetical protein [Halomicroarcula nitratireducens]